MNEHRVAITGLGVLSPLGTGHGAFWDGLLAERVGVGPITAFDASSYATRIAAEIPDFDAAPYVSAKRRRWTDRFSQMALSATALALEDARFDPRGRDDVGVWIGSALGGSAYGDEQHTVFHERGLGAIRPLLAICVYGGAATSNVALEYDLRGPTMPNGNSCAAGVISIGEAYRAIARGDVRAALAGGCEAPIAPLCFGAFVVVGAMSRRNDEPAAASRPFDAGRDGFVMGEGAAILVLERLDDALARGAHVYAEIAGYGIANDAFHPSAPRPDGAGSVAAMRGALREAGLAAGEIELVSAHGSGTPLGDRGEAVALRAVFEEREVPIVATKGQHGHALGATGAWETVAAARILADGIVPRSVNSDDADPVVPVAVTRTRRDQSVRTLLKLAAGFGGINAALVLRAVA